MDIDLTALPDDVAALKDIVRAALAERDSAKVDAAAAQAERSDVAAYIAHLKLQIEKLKRTIYGPRAERTARLLDQMELNLRTLRPPPPRTSYVPSRKPRRAAPLLLLASRASARRGSPSPIICRVSGSSCRGLMPAHVAAGGDLPSLARR